MLLPLSLAFEPSDFLEAIVIILLVAGLALLVARRSRASRIVFAVAGTLFAILVLRVTGVLFA